MFKIGDFSKIAQVSGRMLRHYDKIGLFTPEYTDPDTGYRYYTAKQLPRLNRILALRDMGLGLAQIKQLMHDDITTDEIEHLLYAQKSQVEQTIMQDVARLRRLEFRLQQIKRSEPNNYDVVVKSVSEQNFFSTRRLLTSKADNQQLMAQMSDVQATAQLKNTPVMGILHNDILDDTMDWEIGFIVKHDITRALALPDSYQMCFRQLPAVEQLATTIQDSSKSTSYAEGYNALGVWMEANGYQMSGAVREVGIGTNNSILEMPAIFEIQIPIEKVSD